jgi:hypothetical protein
MPSIPKPGPATGAAAPADRRGGGPSKERRVGGGRARRRGHHPHARGVGGHLRLAEEEGPSSSGGRPSPSVLLPAASHPGDREGRDDRYAGGMRPAPYARLRRFDPCPRGDVTLQPRFEPAFIALRVEGLRPDPAPAVFTVHIAGVGHLGLTDLALSAPLLARLLDGQAPPPTRGTPSRAAPCVPRLPRRPPQERGARLLTLDLADHPQQRGALEVTLGGLVTTGGPVALVHFTGPGVRGVLIRATYPEAHRSRSPGSRQAFGTGATRRGKRHRPPSLQSRRRPAQGS